MENISRIENDLTQKYRKEWDSPNVYAKHIGKEKNSERECFCIFQLDHMTREILRQEFALA